MEWSHYFQNEEFLEKTRMGMLIEEQRDGIIRNIGLRDGDSILDVGCGTGAFGGYLSDGLNHARICGIDNDEVFISYAQKKWHSETNIFDFQMADALSLPFRDDEFDAVVSHTFLTSMPAYKEAIEEMKRVCRPGGKVVSLAAMSISGAQYDKGVYPLTWKWKQRYDELREKLWNMYQALVPYQMFTRGADPGRIPMIFSQMGFQSVSVYPVGSYWSLSNAAIDVSLRKKYIELDYIAERKRMLAVSQLEGADNYMTSTEIEEMDELMLTRKNALLVSVENNDFWEWSGNGNLLVVGVN